MNIKEIFKYVPPKDYDFTLIPRKAPEYEGVNVDKNIDTSIDTNLKFIQSVYNTKINSDIKIREFTLIAKDLEYKAFLLYIDGMSDSKTINDFVLKALMLRNNSNTYNESKKNNEQNNNLSAKKVQKVDIENYIYLKLMPQNALEKVTTFKEIIGSVNSGNCALFVDTLGLAYDIDAKGFKQRSVDTPNNEVIINGPQEAFVENIRTNTSLLRRIINNENLVIENLSVGSISKTSVAMCYMQNIANSELVSEIKFRINHLELDSLLSTGQLSQLIQENDAINIPSHLETERPDKCAKFLIAGRVVLLINGNPYALVLPAVITDFLSSPEDSNLKALFANFLKTLRVMAYFITLLGPGLFVAVTGFHHELLPTELLFSILASREYVPFPIIFELLLMEFSFELIRESGLRVPAPIGGTLGIVGALILGDAAVAAHIVSPILIIVVAITGLSSFAIPDFTFSFHLRVYRFIFILLGYTAGFVGIGAGLLVYANILCSMKSFGVSFTTPLTHSLSKRPNGYFEKPAWMDESRENFLAPKKKYSQPPISKKWRFLHWKD